MKTAKYHLTITNIIWSNSIAMNGTEIVNLRIVDKSATKHSSNENRFLFQGVCYQNS